MKLTIGKYGEGKWFDFGDGKLKIRPYPASMSNVQANIDGFVVISGEDQLKAFMFCLQEWENFKEEEDGIPEKDWKEIKLTDKVKRYIYDYPDLVDDEGTGISIFVLQKGKIAAETLEQEEKN